MKLAFRWLSFDVGQFATRRYVLFEVRGQEDVGKTVINRNQLGGGSHQVLVSIISVTSALV